jgi:hypothetical protein
VLLLALGGCGTHDRELTIEFFDLRSDGLSTEPAADGDGQVVAAEAGFDSEPLLVITEADIASWDTEGLGSIWLVPGQNVSGFSSVAHSSDELVFRLSIDDDSVWGFITYYAQAQMPGFPCLVFPGGLAGMFGFFELWPGGVVLAGVDLWDAARQAWAD